jgi:hypothetical protein
MEWISRIIDKYIEKSTLSELFKAVVNAFLVCRITLFFLATLEIQNYLPTKWDFASIYTYLYQGFFIIPLLILTLVVFFTNALGKAIFLILSSYLNTMVPKISEFEELPSYQVSYAIRKMNILLRKIKNIRLNKERLIASYLLYRPNINSKLIESLQNDNEKPMRTLKKDFTIFLRVLLTIPVYGMATNQVSWIWLVAIFLIITAKMFLQVVMYKFLEIIPYATVTLYNLAERYVCQMQTLSSGEIQTDENYFIHFNS